MFEFQKFLNNIYPPLLGFMHDKSFPTGNVKSQNVSGIKSSWQKVLSEVKA